MKNTFSMTFYCRKSAVRKSSKLAPIELVILLNGERWLFALPRKSTPEDFKREMRSKMQTPTKDYTSAVDRKLRVVGENVADEKEWLKWATEAYKSIYGYEWQGDNLVLARESLVYTFLDYHLAKFGKLPTQAQTRKIAEIVSWNLWQMDGLKGVIPGSCHETVTKEYSLFGDETEIVEKCEGCEKDNIYKHNGIYCKIEDWSARKTIRFIDLLKK